MFSIKKQSQTLFAKPLTIYPFRQYDLLEFAKQQGNKGLDEAGECHALVLAFLRDDNTRAALKENNLKVILPIVRRLSFQLNGEAYREYGSESPEYNTYELPGIEPRQFYCAVDWNNLITLLKMLAFNQGVVLKIGAEKVAAPTLQSPYPTHMLGIKKTGQDVFELFDPNKGVYEGSIKDVTFKLLDLVTHYTAKSKIIGYTTTPIKSPFINRTAMFNDDYSNSNKLISKL
ncbi:hypothetical protein [Legionella cincinnatiensis]|uniref:Uncharacterized protein n=1 Tax=Legionella cincinnatiensis TaxID=28085 RepID=A0A378IKK1_9GAMM|nr:hypothetical protein [Legionella cincinnatiensis]KTC83179.1 hypothetical protein Lcin_2551 [Legionella cincinnatiensis]STX35689.1 Uncharacterised protein [Legionella cincinnatiensis]